MPETKAAVLCSVGCGAPDGSCVVGTRPMGTAQAVNISRPPLVPSARPTRQAHTTSATGANFSMVVLCVCAGGGVVGSGVGGQQQRQRQQQVLGVSNGSEACSSDGMPTPTADGAHGLYVMSRMPEWPRIPLLRHITTSALRYRTVPSSVYETGKCNLPSSDEAPGGSSALRTSNSYVRRGPPAPPSPRAPILLPPR